MRAFHLLLLSLFLAGPVLAQGIETRPGAVVLFGNSGNCSQPATINFTKVQKATPEYRTIRSEGVRKGSARHDLLTSQMNARIERAVAAAADGEGRDCVVRKGDIKDKKGLSVVDLTQAVIGELDS